MTEEDHTAHRLSGKNCMVKLIDGEELFFHVPELEDEDNEIYWMQDVERFMNFYNPPSSDPNAEFLPIGGIVIKRELIKYVRKI